MENRIPVLVTTDKDKGGVFFCYIDPADAEKTTFRAYDVQMCVYWSSDVKGVLGLAANGPTSGCRIGPPAPSGIIHGVTFVGDCSEKAVEAWKSQPWND